MPPTDPEFSSTPGITIIRSDYYLGAKDNFAADRDTANTALGAQPAARVGYCCGRSERVRGTSG
jgi:hypothetical protein